MIQASVPPDRRTDAVRLINAAFGRRPGRLAREEHSEDIQEVSA